MPRVCDVEVVHGVQNGVLIGDSGIKPIWEITFHTGGRKSTGHAFLMFMVRGLTGEGPGARVEVNEQFVGHILRSPGADTRHWFTQTINLSGAVLRDGANELEVHAAANTSGNDQFDDFRLKNVFCFFQQDA